MQRNGQAVIYLLYPDEGHGFVRPENNLSFVAVMEAFLATHLGGQHQDFDADLNGGTIQVLVGANHVEGLEEALSRRDLSSA